MERLPSFYQEPVFVNLFKETRDRFSDWRNLFLGIDSLAPNTGSAGWEQKDDFLLGLTVSSYKRHNSRKQYIII